MSVIDELVQANADYASTFDRGDLPMPPARRLAIVTCMDARIIPSRALGLEDVRDLIADLDEALGEVAVDAKARTAETVGAAR